MPSREDSSWKVSDIISGGSLDVKNMVFMTEAGQGAIPGPQESHHPLISFFCSITAEHHLVLNSFFHEFPGVLAPLSLSTNASLKMYTPLMSGNLLDETKIHGVTDTK